MRLWSLTGAASMSAGGAVYTPGPDGGFDLPDSVAREQHQFHLDGKPMWEDDAERRTRLRAEEAERRRDPASLLAAAGQLGSPHASPATPPSAVTGTRSERPE